MRGRVVRVVEGWLAVGACGWCVVRLCGIFGCYELCWLVLVWVWGVVHGGLRCCMWFCGEVEASVKCCVRCYVGGGLGGGAPECSRRGGNCRVLVEKSGCACGKLGGDEGRAIESEGPHCCPVKKSMGGIRLP